MKELVILIRPEKLEDVKKILDDINCGGMTLSTVIEDKDVETIVEKMRETCATGHVGDGKIFIRDIEDVIRIRTGERGTKAL